MIPTAIPLASSAMSKAAANAKFRHLMENGEPLYPDLFCILEDIFCDATGGQKHVDTANDISPPAKDMLAARISLYQFFDTPKWLWNPGMKSVGDNVVVRVPGEGRSILLTVQRLTDNDFALAKMLEMGGNDFRIKALKAFEKYVPTMKKPVDEDEKMQDRLWPRAPIRPVPDGTMSLEMLFNGVPMTVKGSRTSDMNPAQPQRNNNIRLLPPVISAQTARAAGQARPPAFGALRTLLSIQRSVTASVRALLAPSPASQPANNPWRNNGVGGFYPPPNDSRNPPVVRFAPIILAMVAGGLLASAMIGAGLFSAPATALAISCSALLGVWFACLAFREAARLG